MNSKILLLLLFVSLQASAQDSTSVKPQRKVNIIPLPVIASSPANGLMYGLAPAMNWRMGPETTTSLSSVTSSFIYTTLKQLILTFKSNVFLRDDQWNLIGDWRYFQTSQPTFGLGTGPQSAKLAGQENGFLEYEDGLTSQAFAEAQFMKFNYIRFHETALKRIGQNRFFAGLGYHLDIHSKIDDQMLDLDTVPHIITSHYGYSKKNGFDSSKYTLSGISLNALYDGRDNTINPYKGAYAFLSFRTNPSWLGSDQSSNNLWVEARKYFNLSPTRPRNLLAFWVYSNNQVGGGNQPYLDLPALGWDQFGRSGRAYPQGRFRGQSVQYGEVEWRFPLQKMKEKWGAVVFANFTTASNMDAEIQCFDYINKGYGVGLRYMLSEKSRANICLDYALGDYGAQGFYLSINEVF